MSQTSSQLPRDVPPFQRIGIDILGPLPRTLSRKAYILVVCDYGTRFPFAILLANIEAGTIAEALIGIFSDFGIPKEIQSDQGTNFTAKLTKELYHMLGIDPVFSTPYHAATNGLVENFVGTMKSMIRSLSEVELKTWNKYIPLFLFAYREVPHDSLGFSPFELVFGRSVRGPLDIIRSVWTGTSTTDKNVVHYIIDLRDKLSLMTKAAHENLAQAQTKQKTWYDKKAKEIEYQPGQKVLVLLPSESSKGAQWRGPYQITKRVNDLNYEIDLGTGRKRLRTYHVNLLRLYHERKTHDSDIPSCYLVDTCSVMTRTVNIGPHPFPHYALHRLKVISMWRSLKTYNPHNKTNLNRH